MNRLHRERTTLKNIILLSDGTGNSASKLFKTNVWRLYQALDLSEPGPNNPRQIAYYDDGVGTASFKPLAVLGGAFGWGTKRIVLDLYTCLCRHYEEGDRIYGFGFSRGAFAIRVLTGLIASEGLVNTESESERRHLALQAFRNYREKRYQRRTLLTSLFRGLRNAFFWLMYKAMGKKSYDPLGNRRGLKIKFLGLWDTVAAYGLPIDELTQAWNFLFPLAFPDRNLSDIVENAYHALSIDDERLSFHPELWNEDPDDYSRVPLEDRLTQVWFAGMHSNVGGGYPDDGLSGIPLNWILDNAEHAGLVFLKDERKRLVETARVDGQMYDSRRGLGGAYRYLPRKIKDLTHDDIERKDRVIIDLPKIHESVFKRIENRADGYAPIGLPQKYEVVAADGEIPAPPESDQRALNRVNRQRGVWNLVWWKRVFYFISVGIFLLLAGFPLYGPATPLYDGPLYVLSGLIGRAGALLPDVLALWVKSYQSHPGLFLLIAVVFGVVLAVASRLQARIFDTMRSIFDYPIDEGAPTDATAPSPANALYRLRSNPTLRKFFKWMKEKLIPVVILIIVAMFLLRGLFIIVDQSGLVCRPKSGEVTSTEFPSNDPCWYTGTEVVAGKRYKIAMTVGRGDPEPWADASIKPFPISGFSKWYLISCIPFRRHLTEPWFKPIARIGEYGSDEYPLNPADGASDDDTLIAEITARRGGKLYLFVNDAALPVPNAWQFFYENNSGTAKVVVSPVD